VVDHTLICPPTSRIGPISEQERGEVRSRSPIGSRYDQALDRESAAEMLQERAQKAAEQAEKRQQAEQAEKTRRAEQKKKPAARKSSRQSPTEAAVKSFLRSMSSMLGREIMRGILGAVKKGR
jgi:hypothetical protein